ncbi:MULTISPECIES: addiction module protein [unclassified Roseateles]|uniref:addiction module protein n=1 Tax=unclassified Roseateles TaxID=2626991 RepID=UPI0006F736E7|nr:MULTISPECIES: addiction module protein [unclassified Roseateles]KQW51529.1 addiction module protein [Pelomonas sp. Root405]KRA77762.1 addiction module protein [Pelomonas sp. Root662]
MPIDLAELRKLSVAERIQLAEDLWDSIALDASALPGLTQAQSQEIQRRLRAHDADPSTAVPWEEVRVELMAGPRPR